MPPFATKNAIERQVLKKSAIGAGAGLEDTKVAPNSSKVDPKVIADKIDPKTTSKKKVAKTTFNTKVKVQPDVQDQQKSRGTYLDELVGIAWRRRNPGSAATIEFVGELPSDQGALEDAHKRAQLDATLTEVATAVAREAGDKAKGGAATSGERRPPPPRRRRLGGPS